MPQPKKLYSESEFLFPYVFVGDDAFPVRHSFLNPYSSSNLELVFLIFRLSRARRIIENTFGINAARFRIFCRPILSCLETVENITKACVALHNYLMANKNFGEANSYCPNGFIEQDVRRNGEWRETVKDDYWLIPQSRDCLNNYLQDAKVVRDIFRDYF